MLTRSLSGAGGAEVAVSDERAPNPGPQTDPDAALMLRVRDGEPDAFQTLVERNQRRVFGVLYRVLGRRQDLEDLAQEVFMRVYRARTQYQAKAKFSTWLYAITTRVAFNLLRTASRRPTVPLVLGEPDRGGDGPTGTVAAVSDEPQPEHALQQQELTLAVRNAIDRLPPQQRVALVLSKYEDLSYKDIADTMDTTVTAVRSLLTRARTNLRDLLTPVLRKHQ